MDTNLKIIFQLKQLLFSKKRLYRQKKADGKKKKFTFAF